MPPVPILSIDEITMVLAPSSIDHSLIQDDVKARWLLDQARTSLMDATHLERVFGPLSGTVSPKLPRYQRGFFFDGLGTPDLIQLADAPSRPEMGVGLRLTASGLSTWMERTGSNVADLVRAVSSVEDCTFRVSRIDLDCDFFDCGISLEEFERGLLDGDVCVTRLQASKPGAKYGERRWPSEPRSFWNSGTCRTVYLGSPTAKSDSSMRLYDKRYEQIENEGRELARALSCDSWTRLELTLRHGYACQFGSELLECDDDHDLGQLIARAFLQRCRIRLRRDGTYVGYPDWYASLADGADVGELIFSSPKKDNFDLANSLINICRCGLHALLYKAREVFDEEEAVDDVLGFIKDGLDDYVPGRSVSAWIRKHEEFYRTAYGDIGTFLRAVSERSRLLNEAFIAKHANGCNVHSDIQSQGNSNGV